MILDFKQLLSKSRLIIVFLVFVLVFLVFYFMENSGNEGRFDRERLIEQATAPLTEEEKISRTEKERLLDQAAPDQISNSPSITNEQKDALFEMMSSE